MVTSSKKITAKRAIAIAMALLLLVSTWPMGVFTAFAETPVNYTVIVTDGTNVIEGAEVVITVAGVETDEQTTTAEGKAEFALMEGTDYEYSVSKVGFNTVSDVVDLTTPEVTVALTEKAKIVVTGIVKDAEGNPVENAEVKATGYSEDKTTTDVDGKFTFINIYENEAYEVEISVEGHKPYKAALVTDAENEIQLVAKDVPTVLFAEAEYTVKYGESITVTATTTSDGDIKYSSSDDTVVTVDADGKITVVKYDANPVTITATSEETDDFVSATATYTLKLEKGVQGALTWEKTLITETPWSEDGVTNFVYKNTVTGGTGEGAVKYSSSDDEIATVDEATGAVTFLKPGTVTITATKAGNGNYDDQTAEYTVTVKKAQRADVEFDVAQADVPSILVTQENYFANTVKGYTATFKSENEDVAKVDPSTGMITEIFKGGNLEVTATVAGDEYFEDTTVSYTITILRLDQADFRFEKSTVDVIKVVLGDATYTNPAVGNSSAPIEYKSSNESVATVDENGKITTHKIGTTTITAKVPESDKYSEKEISYELEVIRKTQNVYFNITEIPALTYGETFTNALNAATEITYASNDPATVDVDGDGNLIIKKAGTVTITATAMQNDEYFEASKSYTITVNKADQKITFEKGDAVSQTYNDNGNKYKNTATTNAVADDITATYSIVSGKAENIDSATGEFTITGAGQIVVKVEFNGNDCYNASEAKTYTLDVAKAKVAMKFNPTTITLERGSSKNELPTLDVISKDATGTITYSFENEDADAVMKVIKKINSETGEITLGYGKGNAIVRATIAGDDNYETTTAEYSVKTVSADAANSYEINGTKNSSGWYNGAVSIIGTDQFTLSFEQDGTFTDALNDVAATDGVHTITFYAKKSGIFGGVTDPITVEIKRDSTAPYVAIKNVELTSWEKFLSIITKDWSKGTVDLTLEKSDATSGVASAEYFISDTLTAMTIEELNKIEDWKTWVDDSVVSISENSQAVVYAKVTDVAGNVSYAATNGIIYDVEKPDVNVATTGAGVLNKDDVVQICVNDVAVSSGIKSITYVVECEGVKTQDGTLYTFNPAQEGNPEAAELWSNSNYDVLTFILEAAKNNGTGIITITAEDNAGHVNTGTCTFDMDTVAPVVDIDFLGDSAVKIDNGRGYFNTTRTAKFTITEATAHFDEDAFEKALEIQAKDKAGNNVENAYTILWSHNVDTANRDNDTHTATVTFSKDANYTVSLDSEYADKAGNKVANIDEGNSVTPYEFTIDRAAPEMKVTIGNNFWNKVINTLTFGLWTNDKFDVTANVTKEETSPYDIKYVKISDTVFVSEDELENRNEWVEYTEGAKLTYSEEDIFAVYFKVTDYAGNVIYVNSDGHIIDKTKSDISFAHVGANGSNDIYSDSFDVQINVTDPSKHSGIDKIEYAITANGVETKRETLYDVTYTRTEGENSNGGTYATLRFYPQENRTENNNASGQEPAYTDLLASYSDVITIDASGNNSNKTALTVYVTDNAGNEFDRTIEFDIDTVAPTMELKFTDSPVKVVGERGYFNAPREAHLTITERASHFDEKAAEAGIVIEALAKDGVTAIENAYEITWAHFENDISKPDDDTHVATIKFNEDANYTLSIEKYTDKAGWTAKEITTGASATPYEFTIDTVAPEMNVTIGNNFWNKVINTLTFGLWTNDKFDVTANVTVEETSPYDIKYVKISDTEFVNADTLKESEWLAYTEGDILTYSEEDIFAVYFKVTDYAGNVTYVNSDGHIVDKTASTIEITPDAPNGTNGIYDKDFDVQIAVTDPSGYSGINKIEYILEKSDTENVFTETKKETLYDVTYTRTEGENSNGGTYQTYRFYQQTSASDNAEISGQVPAYTDLLEAYSDKITVDVSENSSCEVKLTVVAYDNAGNKSEEYVKFDIDSVTPTMDLSFNNNDFNRVHADRGYYNAPREAYLTITERSAHFNEATATSNIEITALDVNDQVVENAYDITWEHFENTADPDDDTHLATIKFNKDANYTLAIANYVDASGLTAKEIDTGDSETPWKFTIDTVAPEMEVTIGQNFWNKVISTLTFGLWTNDKFVATAEVTKEETSPVDIEYVKITDSAFKSLDEVSGWKTYTPGTALDFSVEDTFVLYFRVTDYAGNVTYVNSDGHIVDKTASTIEITPDAPHIGEGEDGIYTKDFKVNIKINDPSHYSGLKNVTYVVEKSDINGVFTQTKEVTLYNLDYTRATGENSNGGQFSSTEVFDDGLDEKNYSGKAPEYADLVYSLDKTVTVDVSENNSCVTKLTVYVEDNAGNKSQSSIEFDVDSIAPVMELSYDNDNVNKIENGRGYFNANRTATLVITERTAHFDEAKATENITITASDAKGTEIPVDKEAVITWTHNENTADPDDDTHVATITFLEDANYTLSIEKYVDKADNKASGIITESVAPYTFTVDKVLPTGTISIGELGTWDMLIQTLTFGLWTHETAKVTGTTDDATSPIDSVSYYKTAQTTAISRSELEAFDDSMWTPFTEFEVPANGQFTVYLKIVDKAGNTEYISSNAVIVDNISPVVESLAPEITITPEQPVNGFYNSDVSVAVKVVDPVAGDTFSGIRSIRYEVYNLGQLTQSGDLYIFGIDGNIEKDDLLNVWESQEAIVVDRTLNNSNDVKIVVKATDNAENEIESSVNIQIDTTAPEISVKYDNNNGDSTFDETSYFKADRTATISIRERNFNPDAVKVTITNDHGVIPQISGWTKTQEGVGNGDNTVHTATIAYTADGDYTFDITYSDEAGNANKPVDYSDSLAPTKFSIDKILPEFSITYDNNDVLNGNYYKADRVATIVVNEHNFETSRVNISLVATDNGTPSALPAVSNWTSNGDIHTATITYNADSLYTFDFDYADKAGNKTYDIEPHTFYVDKTNPVVSITKIVDQSANGGDDNIGFVISATDTNLGEFKPVLTVINSDGTSQTVNIGSMSDIANGKAYTVSNIDTDGIYRITCTAVDKAGNAYSQVTLQRENGSTYVENRAGNDTLITFSVNRDGSTFSLDEATENLVNQYYVQNVENDIKIVEINTDTLTEHKVTLNGKELKEGQDYTVSSTEGTGGWMRYVYTIKQSLFAEEGEYSIVVFSKDEAENNAFSDVKQAGINFVVDRTAPVITVTGMVTGGRYQVDKQPVTIIPTDDGGALNSIKVILVDEDGKEIKTLLDLAGEKLDEALEKGEGKLVFEIEESKDLYQFVRIICNDCAVDKDGKTNTYDETFENISVSTSGVMMFWANKPARYGSMIGLGVVIGIIIFIIISKKKKKDEENK